MGGATTVWPDDADGDVFRRMQESGFDFSQTVDIDFNVDFDQWPPAPAFLKQLRGTYPNAQVIKPQDGYRGYVQFVVRSVLTYELVMSTQSSVSAMAAPSGGVCESWGAMQPD